MSKQLIAIILLISLLLSGCGDNLKQEIDYTISPDAVPKSYTVEHAPVPTYEIGHTDRNAVLAAYKEMQQRKINRNRILAESEAEDEAKKLEELKRQSSFVISTPIGNFHDVDEVEAIFGTRRAAQDFSFLSLVYSMKFACQKFEDDDNHFESVCYDYRAFEKEFPDFMDKEMYNEMKPRLEREYELMMIDKYDDYREKIGDNDINNFRAFVMFLQQYRIQDPKEFAKFRDEVRLVYKDFHSQYVTEDETKPSFY